MQQIVSRLTHGVRQQTGRNGFASDLDSLVLACATKINAACLYLAHAFRVLFFRAGQYGAQWAYLLIRRKLVAALGYGAFLSVNLLHHVPVVGHGIAITLSGLILEKYGRWLCSVHFHRAPDRAGRLSGMQDLLRGNVTVVPIQFFDPAYYQQHFPGRSLITMEALLHFLLVGRWRRMSPTPWFSYPVYLRKNPDIAGWGGEPFRHFVTFGLREGRSASDMFNPAGYLAANPDVAAGGMPALEHFVCYGQVERRRGVPLPPGPEEPRFAGSDHDADHYLRKILALPRPGAMQHLFGWTARAAVDVIIPVYRGKCETITCLYRVLSAANGTASCVVVVDDCSPEEDLSDILRLLAKKGYIRLIRNPVNEGFVRSVNKAMQLHPARDVILLNSDTEVFGDWIDRLRKAAQANARFGTVTPLTNNGTVCSYPFFNEDNDRPLEVPYAEIDRIAASVNAGEPIELPTAIGFCMYIKRELIDRIGYFDAEAFGTGYGEENDFSLRAIDAGWKNVAAPNVFVRHLGATSFREERRERIEHAMRVIDERHPHYQTEVQAFLKADPLRNAREQIDRERLRRACRAQNVLLVSHIRGGGTEQHVREEMRRLEAAGYGVFRAVADPRFHDRFDIVGAHVAKMPMLSALHTGLDLQLLQHLADDLAITEVHVHHIMDFGARPASSVTNLLRHLQRPWRVVVHDYFGICPRVNLIDTKGIYCGEPGDSACQTCLQASPTEFGVPDIRAWRADYHEMLAGAQAVVVPDEDVARRLRGYFPDIGFQIRPHDNVMPMPLLKRPRPGSRILRVGVLGAISAIKGFEKLIDCATDAQLRGLPVEFVVIGYTENDDRAAQAGITVTGPYDNATVLETIDALDIDVIFLPSVWPETYSYTLSLALRAARPIIVFDVGAAARRIRGLHGHKLVPLHYNGWRINNTILELLP